MFTFAAPQTRRESKMQQLSLIKDNPNAPQIRFIRKNGRVIPIVQKKKVTRAAPLVDERLEEMKIEVEHATKGERGVGYDENRNAVKNFSIRSTYPDFYREAKFRNKNEFFKTIEKREGQKFDALAGQAIDDLKGGYETSFGRVPPNLHFRVLTKQTFDNTNVVFRRINGRVVPIRNPKAEFMKDDEIPF